MLMIGHDYIFKNTPKSDAELSCPKSTTSTELITENTEISKSEEYEHLI